MHAEAMISTHPQARGHVNDALAACIESCLDCAQTCTACADACLGESSIATLSQCIRLNLDCAEFCATVARVGSRRTTGNAETLRRLVELCADVCRQCAEECQSHGGHHRHCAICAETCRSCEKACRTAAATLTLPNQ